MLDWLFCFINAYNWSRSMGHQTRIWKKLGKSSLKNSGDLSMFLLHNGHNKSSFDHTPTQSHANHNDLTEAVAISTVMHCVPHSS